MSNATSIGSLHALAIVAAGTLLSGCVGTGSGGAVATRSPAGALAVASEDSLPAPVLEAVTFHVQVERYQTVYPEFHFRDASGTVSYIHRELIATNDPGLTAINTDGIIHISAELQRAGTVFVGGWPCGPASYYVTIRAFLVNLDGHKSNPLQYTIHCNGG